MDGEVQMCGPWEIGAYYEPTAALTSARFEGKNVPVPFDVKPDVVVLCVKSVKRFNRYLEQPRHVNDDLVLFVEFARFAYYHPSYGDGQFLATFDIGVGPGFEDSTAYLKKVTSPLRILSLAGEGLIP